MSVKFHSLIVAVLLGQFVGPVQSGQPSPFASDIMGQCFPSPEAALRKLSGSDELDENISVEKRSELGQDKFWIVDRTGGHNHQWYLFESSAKPQEYCASLYIPFASETSTHLTHGALTIEARTQPSPGGRSYEMYFRRSLRLHYFVPILCHAIDIRDKGEVTTRRIIDCLNVGD